MNYNIIISVHLLIFILFSLKSLDLRSVGVMLIMYFIALFYLNYNEYFINKKKIYVPKHICPTKIAKLKMNIKGNNVTPNLNMDYRNKFVKLTSGEIGYVQNDSVFRPVGRYIIPNKCKNCAYEINRDINESNYGSSKSGLSIREFLSGGYCCKNCYRHGGTKHGGRCTGKIAKQILDVEYQTNQYNRLISSSKCPQDLIEIHKGGIKPIKYSDNKNLIQEFHLLPSEFEPFINKIKKKKIPFYLKYTLYNSDRFLIYKRLTPVNDQIWKLLHKTWNETTEGNVFNTDFSLFNSLDVA